MAAKEPKEGKEHEESDLRGGRQRFHAQSVSGWLGSAFIPGGLSLCNALCRGLCRPTGLRLRRAVFFTFHCGASNGSFQGNRSQG